VARDVLQSNFEKTTIKDRHRVFTSLLKAHDEYIVRRGNSGVSIPEFRVKNSYMLPITKDDDTFHRLHVFAIAQARHADYVVQPLAPSEKKDLLKALIRIYSIRRQSEESEKYDSDELDNVLSQICLQLSANSREDYIALAKSERSTLSIRRLADELTARMLADQHDFAFDTIVTTVIGRSCSNSKDAWFNTPQHSLAFEGQTFDETMVAIEKLLIAGLPP
jgi:hypothetical protein